MKKYLLIVLSVAVIIIDLLYYFLDPYFFLGWGNWLNLLLFTLFANALVRSGVKDSKEHYSYLKYFKNAWIFFSILVIIDQSLRFIVINYLETKLLDLLFDVEKKMFEDLSIDYIPPNGVISYSFKEILLSLSLTILVPGLILSSINAIFLKFFQSPKP
jgi:hypothetical protein